MHSFLLNLNAIYVMYQALLCGEMVHLRSRFYAMLVDQGGELKGHF